jgi:cell wall-active antibiotic response 4TMS protein YvqF
MTVYMTNRTCPCARCRAKGLLGAAVLITLGILWLLKNFAHIRFDETWPALLIVIGVVLYLGRTAPIDGHIPPFYPVGPVAPPPAPAAPPQPQNDSQVNP